MKKTLNVAVIGTGFMGRMHSSTWLRLNQFFDADYKVNLKLICSRRRDVAAFAHNWGYDEYCSDWHEAVERKDIDIVSIVTPTFLHKEMVIAAARAGKHIVCEKPCAITYADCVEMLSEVEKAGVTHYINHNYRRVPAVAYAKKLVEEGRLGKIYHWRGAYMQDWIMDQNFPLTWQLKKETAGGGPLFDLGSHAVDLARFIVGEPVSVMAMNQTFIKERPLPGANAAAFTAGTGNSAEKGEVTVDDAAFMVLQFEGGELGSIDTTRYAAGCRNYNDFELYGSKGSLHFNFQRMNELEFLDAEMPQTEQGQRTILVTEPEHPYLNAWWPRGHVLGYEHSFVNAFYDFVQAISGKTVIRPNIEDGAKIIRVLEAARKSSEEGRVVNVTEII